MTIAEKINFLRTNKNLSQKDLADILHVSSQAISNWERGKGYPYINNIIRISDFFNISLDELIKEDKNYKEILTNKKIEKRIDVIFSAICLLISSLVFVFFIYKSINMNFQEINYFPILVGFLGIITFIPNLYKYKKSKKA